MMVVMRRLLVNVIIFVVVHLLLSLGVSFALSALELIQIISDLIKIFWRRTLVQFDRIHLILNIKL